MKTDKQQIEPKNLASPKSATLTPWRFSQAPRNTRCMSRASAAAAEGGELVVVLPVASVAAACVGVVAGIVVGGVAGFGVGSWPG